MPVGALRSAFSSKRCSARKDAQQATPVSPVEGLGIRFRVNGLGVRIWGLRLGLKGSGLRLNVEGVQDDHKVLGGYIRAF